MMLDEWEDDEISSLKREITVLKNQIDHMMSDDMTEELPPHVLAKLNLTHGKVRLLKVEGWQ